MSSSTQSSSSSSSPPSSSTKPRPIHYLHRELRSTPDEAEPSFSYERDAFLLHDREEEVEDEFHRRLAGHYHLYPHTSTTATTATSSSSSTSNNNNNSNSFRHRRDGSASSSFGTCGSAGGGGGSFWRSSTAEASSIAAAQPPPPPPPPPPPSSASSTVVVVEPTTNQPPNAPHFNSVVTTTMAPPLPPALTVAPLSAKSEKQRQTSGLLGATLQQQAHFHHHDHPHYYYNYNDNNHETERSSHTESSSYGGDAPVVVEPSCRPSATNSNTTITTTTTNKNATSTTTSSASFVRSNSNASTNSRERCRKVKDVQMTRQRAADRRVKLEATRSLEFDATATATTTTTANGETSPAKEEKDTPTTTVTANPTYTTATTTTTTTACTITTTSDKNQDDKNNQTRNPVGGGGGAAAAAAAVSPQQLYQQQQQYREEPLYPYHHQEATQRPSLASSSNTTTMAALAVPPAQAQHRRIQSEPPQAQHQPPPPPQQQPPVQPLPAFVVATPQPQPPPPPPIRAGRTTSNQTTYTSASSNGSSVSLSYDHHSSNGMMTSSLSPTTAHHGHGHAVEVPPFSFTSTTLLSSPPSLPTMTSTSSLPLPTTTSTGTTATTSSTVAPPPSFGHLNHMTSLDRSSSDQSTGSLFYGKTPSSGAVLGKSSSLIFPTGVETTGDVDDDRDSDHSKRRKINLLLDNCEAVRFPFKKKLMLNNLSLAEADIPLSDLCGTSLGHSLHKLSLAGNRLGNVPEQLVQSLPSLKHLDLSQCDLHRLPERWNLPKLARLNLSHNSLTDFPEELMLEGLPELHELNMYGNKVAEIVIPSNPKLLSKLETLNLGYNDLAFLPDELDQITSLRTLKVMNNFLEKVPMRVCDMDLRTLDVSSNPVIMPPIETCERGICSMKRYYQCLRMEEQTKQKALEEVQKKLQRQKNKNSKKKGYGAFIKSLSSKTTGKPAPMTSRRTSSEDSQSVESSSGTIEGPVVPKLASTAPGNIRDQRLLGNYVPSQLLRTSSPEVDSKPPADVLSSPASTVHEDIAGGSQTDLFEAHDDVTVNDNLKVIFVGMAMVGKTSMIKRLIEGRDAVIPTHDERTVGVDIYEWDPKKDRRFSDIDSRIQFQDQELAAICGDVDVKFSVWDFAGQHVYHATHELFFSPRALYVLVWDMGATNRATLRRKKSYAETGAFRLTYDSSDEEEEPGEEDDSFTAEEEARRADRALEHDIDEKVQFWVDCIQSSAPGSAILPVASFSDYFDNEGGEAEAKRRCSILKQRLLKHEERRKNGIRERYMDYYNANRADDVVAMRLRKLLCPHTRPKLIFAENDSDSVVRVSGLRYTGFHELTEKIINIATGRVKFTEKIMDIATGRVELKENLYPIFHGHIGARIPRMRFEVREAVRTMRDRFKVVEWGYFICQLRDRGLTSVEDISDALHFLTSIGELSYFGGVMADSKQYANPMENSRSSNQLCDPRNMEELKKVSTSVKSGEDDDDDEEMDDEPTVLSVDNTRVTAPSTDEGSMSSVDDLSQFVFLNPRWLVAAVACILRHDLDREIIETRRQTATPGARRLVHAGSFYDAHVNCPVITAEDACMLWQAKRITKKAAERAQEYSNNMTVTPFEFLQLLLIRFGVFVPIDLGIEKVFFGGKEYGHLVGAGDTPTEINIEPSQAESPRFFFLPSLLGPCEPSDAWTYKSSDSWKITLCHSILFPDGVPPGLMERLTASVLSSIYAAASRKSDENAGPNWTANEGLLNVKEILCWRTAFFIKVGNRSVSTSGPSKESIVEIFCLLADRDSHLCVGSDYMGVGMRRLIICARGQVGDGGRKIWKGGYLIVVKCVRRVMEQYGGLEYETHAFCPECLSKKAVSEAGSWEFSTVRAAVQNGEDTIRCRQHGHRVDTCLVAGPIDNTQKPKTPPPTSELLLGTDTVVPVRDLLRAVVVVGLWDGKSQKVVRVGSGFVVDRKRGLIVTASHTLMNIWGDKNYPFGEDYYGLRQGKVVIGVIPEEKELDSPNAKDMAVFRYFAKIVAKDPSLEHGECHLDACVLRITTRMESDVGGDGQGCGEQPEILLLNNPRALKNEKLQSLKLTDKCELDEQVRILGYNQGGEGLLAPGESLNRFVDFARGYVCMKFAQGEASKSSTNGKLPARDRFKPREEIVVICPTIGGHSGGPCVNQQGEVIGILSRADPTESQRCYISPTYEWKNLVKQAKNML